MLKKYQNRAIAMLALASTFIFINSNLSSAQQSDHSTGNKSHSLYDGSRALQFRIASDFVLDDFQGAALSVKKHISDKSAIRLGLNLFLDLSTRNSDNRIYSGDTTITINDTEISEQRIMLELQYVRYVSTDRKIKFFWGTGPTVRLHREVAETDYSNSYYNISRPLKDEDKSWGLGGSGILGVEWFPIYYISFHTEYMLTILYEWQKIRNDEVTGANYYSISTEEKGIEIYASDVRFGLSLYF